MTAYVIVPGLGDCDALHWQSIWEREWGETGARISPGSWSEPDLTDWVHAVQYAQNAASLTEGPVFLVAHGLGCWAAVTWLTTRSSHRVAGAFLVAPPDPRAAAFPDASAASFTGLSAQPLPCPALVVASDDDPYCTPQAAAGFAEGWEAHFHMVVAHGHVDSASNLGPWPQGRQLLDYLLWHQSN